MKFSIKNFAERVSPRQFTLVLFSCVAIFMTLIVVQRSNHLSDPSDVRYTITKFEIYEKWDWRFRYRGYFWVNGMAYHSEYDPSVFDRETTKPNFVIGRYFWVKFNIKDPTFNDVIDGEITQSFADSIPIPNGGISEAEYQKLRKSLESEANTYRTRWD